MPAPSEERLTYDQIKSLYDGQWVMVEDPECDDQMQVLGGRVIAHSRDRIEFDQTAMKLHPRDAAVLCFAKSPRGWCTCYDFRARSYARADLRSRGRDGT